MRDAAGKKAARPVTGRFVSAAAMTTLAIFVALMLPSLSLAEAGADTYKAKCAACHGARGTGDTVIGKNLKLRSLGSEEVQKQSDDDLFTIINKGKHGMPAFEGKLSKDQIQDLVKFVRSLKN
jgi:mono/diheme cytochrome c family protein